VGALHRPGFKVVENRTWPTRHRAPVLIHASRTLEQIDNRALKRLGVARPSDTDLVRGGIVGIVELVDCLERSVNSQAGKLNFYWLYFQTPGVAEAEFERDVVGTFRRLAYAHGGSFDVPAGHGFLDGFPEPAQLPDRFNTEDLAVYADSCRRTGFRGGLNWFRNMDRNWELSAPWQDVPIRQPTLFIAGGEHGVVNSPMLASHFAKLSETVPGLKRKLLVPGVGHWVDRERPRGEFSPCGVFAWVSR